MGFALIGWDSAVWPVEDNQETLDCQLVIIYGQWKGKQQL